MSPGQNHAITWTHRAHPSQISISDQTRNTYGGFHATKLIAVRLPGRHSLERTLGHIRAVSCSRHAIPTYLLFSSGN